MAMRPVFLPKRSRTHFVLEAPVEFQWSAGLSTSQKQKSIASLHQAARQRFGVRSPLEVSSKSASPLGVALSAFNLRLQLEGGGHATVETSFQGSKKFAQAGPFPELLAANSRDAKRDPRLRDSGPLVGFELQGERWPLTPRTAFYDWLYLKALKQNQDLAAQLLQHDLFTDIEFNPERSLNCQARSCALYVSLHQAGLLEDALSDRVRYLDILLQAKP